MKEENRQAQISGQNPIPASSSAYRRSYYHSADNSGWKFVGALFGGAAAIIAGLLVYDNLKGPKKPEYLPTSMINVVNHLRVEPHNEKWFVNSRVIYASGSNALVKEGSSSLYLQGEGIESTLKNARGLFLSESGEGGLSLIIEGIRTGDGTQMGLDQAIRINTDFDGQFANANHYKHLPSTLRHDRKGSIKKVIGGADGGALVSAKGAVEFNQDLKGYVVRFGEGPTGVLLTGISPDQEFFLDAAMSSKTKVQVFGSAESLWDYKGKVSYDPSTGKGSGRGSSGIIAALKVDNVAAFGKNIPK
ncbi:hypothetical protein D6745_02450 [Candidatus Woesearchaeota archaeon]|nr:MAG: hypothetical protein D6745_02450 [Candidatus Woesearchaeota archaeon]